AAVGWESARAAGSAVATVAARAAGCRLPAVRRAARAAGCLLTAVPPAARDLSAWDAAGSPVWDAAWAAARQAPTRQAAAAPWLRLRKAVPASAGLAEPPPPRARRSRIA